MENGPWFITVSLKYNVDLEVTEKEKEALFSEDEYASMKAQDAFVGNATNALRQELAGIPTISTIASAVSLGMVYAPRKDIK